MRKDAWATVPLHKLNYSNKSIGEEYIYSLSITGVHIFDKEFIADIPKYSIPVVPWSKK